MRSLLILLVGALALAGAFERRSAEQPDDSMADLLQRAGADGGLDPSGLEEAMRAMMGGGGRGGGGDMAKMMEVRTAARARARRPGRGGL